MRRYSNLSRSNWRAFFFCHRIVFLALTCMAMPGWALAQGGNFLAGVNYAVTGQGGIATGDFNGDQKLDLAIANQNGTVGILLGNGDGTFQAQYTVNALPSTGPYSTYVTESVAVGDFNGDGKADLAVLSRSSDISILSNIRGVVTILAGNGDGTFGAPTTNALDGAGPLVLLAADLKKNGTIDLAVLDTVSPTVTILLGNGDGTFQPGVDYTTVPQPLGLTVGDLNGDGYPDLAVEGIDSSGNGVVNVFLNNQDGTFGNGVNWITAGSDCSESCSAPTAAAIGDFNGDGKADLAVNDGFVGGLFVLLGNGDGTFQTPAIYSAGPADNNAVQGTLVARDFDADGRLDLAMSVGGAVPDSPDLLIFRGNGDGTFALPLRLSVGTAGAESSATSLVSVDLNGDSYPDLVLGTNPGPIGVGFDAATVVLNCGLRCTSTTLSSSPTNSVFNQGVTFTAVVAPANSHATGTPTGSVTFTDTSGSPLTVTTLGTALLSGGQATFIYSALGVGSHSISASYQGDTNFDTSASTALSQAVAVAPTTTSINSSPDPSDPGQSVTFSASVAPSTAGTPTGDVTFSDNGTQSASVQLDASGSASFTTSSLTAGTHSITWSYSGDSDFAPSTSDTLTQIVGANAAPFAMSSSPSSATVSPGQSATFSISVMAVPSFKTSVSFSCSGLPAMATCQFQPASVNPNGAIATTALTISTTGSQAVLLPSRGFSDSKSGFLAIVCCGLLTLPWLFLTGLQQTGRNRFRVFLALAWLLAVAAGMTTTGCGGGMTTSPQTPAGMSQVTVTASSGSSTQSQTVTLIVN